MVIFYVSFKYKGGRSTDKNRFLYANYGVEFYFSDIYANISNSYVSESKKSKIT